MDSKSWELVCGPRNEDYADVGCMKGSGAMQATEQSQQGHSGNSADATEV